MIERTSQFVLMAHIQCRILFFILLWGFYGTILHGQIEINPQFEFYSADNGLSENSVNAIFQDQQGFIWFATNGGLSRFDGYSFKVFRHDPDNPNSLSSNFIRDIFEDSQGDLWIITNVAADYSLPDKLTRLNQTTGTFERFQHDPEIAGSICAGGISGIVEDLYGNLWIRGSGLHRMNRANNTFECFQSSASPFAMICDKNGNIWFNKGGAPGRGLGRIDLVSTYFRHEQHDPKNAQSPMGNPVGPILEDSDG